MATMPQPVMDALVPPAVERSPGRPGESLVSVSAEFREPDTSRVTLTIKIAVGVVTPMVGFLAVLGGIGSFNAVRHLAVPWFGHSAWIVPVGIDVGILTLLSWDLIAEYLALPLPLLRWTAWGFIGATVYLNIAAAHGNLTAAVMHAAMPTLFVSVTEGIRHLIRQLAGLAAGTRIERIPAARWMFAPLPTLLLKRRMVLWQVTSYKLALALEHRRLQAVARLQEAHGRYCWRWRASLSDRLSLRLMPADMSVDAVALPEEADGEPDTMSGFLEQQSCAASPLSHLLPHHCLIEPPKAPDAPTAPEDRALIAAAVEILRDAKRDSTRITQGVLAKLLRERGHRVANNRLGWLMTAAQRAATTSAAPTESIADEVAP